MTGGMLALYLLLTLGMGTAIVVGIVRTQTAEVEGKLADGSVVKKSWREWGAGREARVNQVEPARRGDILSSDGKVLATTVSECDLYLDLGKRYETDKKGKKKFSGAVSDSVLYASLDTMALILSESMGRHAADYYVQMVKKEREKENPRQCFRVEQHVPYSVWLSIARLPGWKRCVVKEVDRRSVKYEVRAHIYREMASNTVGLENGRGTGDFTGLEGAYDSLLRGRDGVFNSRRLTKGVWIEDVPDEGSSSENRTDGDSVERVVLQKRIDGVNIVSTIDTRIQDVAEDALRQTLARFGGKAGCAIVMEVETGYVVACANLARAEQKPVEGEESSAIYNELRDWNTAVSSRYEPGSTMKTVALMAMLNDPKLKIDTAMKVRVGTGVFPTARVVKDSHKKNGRDSLSVKEVIEESSNVGMCQLGWMYYRDRRDDLVALMRQVFPYEKLNLDVRSPEPKTSINDVHLSVDDFLRLTYGYSTAVTPMQIITFYNALAGDGRMVKPLFCRAIVDRRGRRTEMKPVVLRNQAFSKESAKVVREMLEGVVDHGTAKRMKSEVYHFAGKTGTADYYDQASRTHTQAYNNSSFAGFFPAERPRYTCYVMLERVPHEAFGTQAARVFRTIADCVMAIDERLSADLAALSPVDSAKLLQRPVLLRGNQSEMKKAFELLGCSYSTTNPESRWVVYRGGAQDSLSAYRAEEPVQGRVPNCYGMSAKDAVELLHSMGLKVRLTGYGKVVSQTPSAGTAAKKGTLVMLKLVKS